MKDIIVEHRVGALVFFVENLQHNNEYLFYIDRGSNKYYIVEKLTKQSLRKRLVSIYDEILKSEIIDIKPVLLIYDYASGYGLEICIHPEKSELKFIQSNPHAEYSIITCSRQYIFNFVRDVMIKLDFEKQI